MVISDQTRIGLLNNFIDCVYFFLGGGHIFALYIYLPYACGMVPWWAYCGVVLLVYGQVLISKYTGTPVTT